MIPVVFAALISLSAAVPPQWWNSTECGTSPYADAGSGCLSGSGVCPLVVGGIEARENEFPYMVSLESFDAETTEWTHFCGGALINEQWILTLATCTLVAEPWNNMRVVLGAHSRSQPSLNQVTIAVEDVITHTDFDVAIADANDIGLVKMIDPVSINEFITPVCPPDAAVSYVGSSDVVAGWGATSRNGPVEDTLRYTNVSIGSDTFCMSEIFGYDAVGKHCASNGDYSRDTCDGDAGSPLVDIISGQFVAVALASAGIRCADNKPGIYTNVADFDSWVTDTLAKNP